MATFAELILEAIEDNYHHTGIITDVDHKKKIIHINRKKSHILSNIGKYAKYGAAIGGVSGGVRGAILGGTNKKNINSAITNGAVNAAFNGIYNAGVIGAYGAGTGAIVGAYQKIKDRKMVNKLLNAGYKIQYDE